MAELDVNVADLPRNMQDSFRDLAMLLGKLAGENLLGLSAFGGWLVDDPLYRGTPARGVAVLGQFDLGMLDQLATEGVRLGKRGLSAPLMMTPEYIKASCDVFPLELLEIQQLNMLVCGADHFGELTFARSDVRLQCEREIKGELIQLRQGLLSVGGKHDQLGGLCRVGAERAMRILRGVLHLADAGALRSSTELVAKAAEVTNVKLNALAGMVGQSPGGGLEGFTRLYEELTELATYVDGLAA